MSGQFDSVSEDDGDGDLFPELRKELLKSENLIDVSRLAKETAIGLAVVMTRPIWKRCTSTAADAIDDITEGDAAVVISVLKAFEVAIGVEIPEGSRMSFFVERLPGDSNSGDSPFSTLQAILHCSRYGTPVIVISMP